MTRLPPKYYSAMDVYVLLELLIGNMELRKTMGAGARERAVSSYDWDNVAKQIHAINREVIG